MRPGCDLRSQEGWTWTADALDEAAVIVSQGARSDKDSGE